MTKRGDEPSIGVDGVIEWRDEEGELHRVGGPARVFPSGREEWFRLGCLHRSDGPAVIHANGSVKYYVDGVRHREDGPACVYVNGTEKWYRMTGSPGPTDLCGRQCRLSTGGCRDFEAGFLTTGRWRR